MKLLEYIDTIFKEEDFNWITSYKWFKNYIGDLKYTTFNIKPSIGWKGYNQLEVKISINPLFDFVIVLNTHEIGEYGRDKTVSVHFSNHFNWKVNPSDVNELDHFYGYYTENAMKFLGCGRKYSSLDTLEINDTTAERFINLVEGLDAAVPMLREKLSWLNISYKPWEISSDIHSYFNTNVIPSIAGKL